MNKPPMIEGRRGFVLLEAMLAVAIFAIGVISLGRCVGNCLAAERFKVEEERAGRVLQNRMAEIEAGAVGLDGPGAETLKGAFAGLKLEQSAQAVTKQNENEEDLSGLQLVNLRVSWVSGGDVQSRELVFYVLPRNL